MGRQVSAARAPHTPAVGMQVYTVTEVTRAVRALIEERFSSVWIQGEISNFRHQSASGHMYFDLKDEGGVLHAAMFRGANQRLRFLPENGLKVIAHGELSVYEKRGEYQLIADYLEPAGLGALQMAFEQLKARLEAEGLFDAARKRPIPTFPSRIGIVTSLEGAAIRDILNILGRRYPPAGIAIAPVRVQGEGAALEIAGAIHLFNTLATFDVLIVGRGGGSLEDLWAFNEEVVARAIADSRIPVVSAVGHEVDFTIADFVADLRAPTPSAAAELVVPDRAELVRQLEGYRGRMNHALRMRGRSLTQEVDDLVGRLYRAIDQRLEACRSTFAGVVGKLETLSPLAILSRGYSVTRTIPDHHIVKDAGQCRSGDDVEVLLHKGRLVCRVHETEANRRIG